MSTFPYEVVLPDGIRYRQAEIAGGNKVFARHLNDYEIYYNKVFVAGHKQYYIDTREWYWRSGDPAVYWMFGCSSAEIRDDAQRAIIKLNPYTTSKKIRVGLDWMRAYNNGFNFGFDTKYLPTDSRYTPHRDLFNNVDLDAPTIAHDKIRTTANNTYRGEFSTDGDWFYPEYIPEDDFPAWSDFEGMWWLQIIALTMFKDASGYPRFEDFNQGNGHQFRLPFIAKPSSGDRPKIPARAVQVVEEMADPYTTYIGV